MGILEFVFFGLFALTIFSMYVAVRRELAPLGLVGGLGMVASIVTMMLFLLQRVETALQGILFGILIGAVIALATLSTAWYFHTQERRANTD